jgi:hypothetical protein
MGIRIAVVAALLVSACIGCTDRDGPAERTGERIDDAVSDARDRLDDAGDEIREAGEEIRDALRDE